MENETNPETKAVPSDRDRIMIVGGYGQVGRLISERLALAFPHRVTVAGRNLEKAKATAVKIGYGAEGRAVDIFAADAAKALGDVALVIVCLDQTDTRFVEQCLSDGIHYVDISADYGFLSEVEKLDDLAKRNGTAAMLSVGVVPGLSNMLAARAREKMERTDRIDIAVKIGLGDHHGRAAMEWMVDNLDATYEVMENGRPRCVRSFGESLSIRLPGRLGERRTYRFNFADQHVVARTLDVPSVSTWICLGDRISTWLFAKSSQAGLGGLLRRRWWRSAVVWLFMNIHMGSDVCCVAVQAKGRTKDGSDTLTLGLIGRTEALMTAIVTAETARQMLSGTPVPGVLHSEQAIALDPIVSALRNEVPGLVVAL